MTLSALNKPLLDIAFIYLLFLKMFKNTLSKHTHAHTIIEILIGYIIVIIQIIKTEKVI